MKHAGGRAKPPAGDMQKVLRDLEALREGISEGRGFDQLRFESPQVSALARDLVRHQARRESASGKSPDRHASREAAGGSSLSKAMLEKEQFRSSLNELQKILDLCRVISSAKDLKDILHHLLFLLSEVLPSRGCAVFVGRGDTGQDKAGAAWGSPLLASNFTPALRQALSQHLEEGIIRWALAERRVCLIPSFDEGEPGGYAAVPLIDNESSFGFIWAATAVPHDDVTPEAMNLVWVLASHASVAILNCLHRQQMEEKINELRLLASINSLKGDILRRGMAREADSAAPAENGPLGGNLPIFYAELLKVLSRELKLERGHLLLSAAERPGADDRHGHPAAGKARKGAVGVPLALFPPHPALEGSGFLDLPELRKLLRLADREQVRVEAGDFFGTSFPTVARSLGSEGLAVLSLATPDARPLPGAEPGSPSARGAWLLLPLDADDLQRLPTLQGLLLAVVSQARMVAENMGLYDSLLEANRNLTSLQWQQVHSGKLAALGQLAGGVAHEINNPLQIMLGRIQMIQMMAENPGNGSGTRIKEEIDLVTEEILRIRDIVRNLLDFSRQGKREASFAPVSLNDTLKDVLALLDHQLRSAQVELRLDLARENPRVLGNRNQLKQVFINLLMNAMHAMEREPKVLEVRTRVHEGDAQASIRDTGIGISKENLSRIFEPFFSTKTKGTGLGLSISYGLVKDHRGTMEVESREDHGTCFVINIPRLAEAGMGYNVLVG